MNTAALHAFIREEHPIPGKLTPEQRMKLLAIVQGSNDKPAP